jgi:hypothetical protein
VTAATVVPVEPPKRQPWSQRDTLGWLSSMLLCHALFVLAQDACLQPGVRCDRREEHSRVNTVGLRRRGHERHWAHSRRCPSETNFTLLEDLWPAQHFRGPMSGPKSYFRRVPPHYLGHHADFTRCRRRVYIDIGAGQFNAHGSSEGFLSMLKLYPPLLDFDEFYCMEAVPGRYNLPPQPELQKMLTAAGMSVARASTFSRRHFFLQAFAGARSDPSTTPPTIGLSDLLQTMLQLQPADAVVIKM